MKSRESCKSPTTPVANGDAAFHLKLFCARSQPNGVAGRMLTQHKDARTNTKLLALIIMAGLLALLRYHTLEVSRLSVTAVSKSIV